MAFILNIDTALETASVSLAEDGNILHYAINESQKDHAAWLQPAIKKLLNAAGCKPGAINAIAVSNGPGSYTGLRVGLATAKGLCYALKVPMIAVSTLEVMALSAIKNAELFDSSAPRSPLPAPALQSPLSTSAFLICPMIDARRMEVFTAVYDRDLSAIMSPRAMMVTEHSFEDLLKGHKILFLGNGSTKFQGICRHEHAIFKNFPFSSPALASLTYSNYIGNNFAELAYTEPLYLKEFFTARDAGLKKAD